MQFSAVQNVSMATGAPGAPGNAAQVPDGLNDSWDIGDTLTANDKALLGWVDPRTTPGLAKVNAAADILSYYRHSGQLSGDVTSDFVDAIKTAIANGKGIPLNPAQLMSKGSSQPLLSSQTASALFSILQQDRPASA